MDNFTIISNNCWGAEVYKDYKIGYNTPFVGLFVPPICYIKLLKNLSFYLSNHLDFIDFSKYEIYNNYRLENNLRYPIGVLNNDIEIHFLHYESKIEALEKWNRRLQRLDITDSRVFFKFCDREIGEPTTLYEFDQLPFTNKVCFTSKPHKNLRCGIWIIENKNCSQVSDGKSLYTISKRYFNVKGWIETGNGSLNLAEKINRELLHLKYSLLR